MNFEKPTISDINPENFEQESKPGFNNEASIDELTEMKIQENLSTSQKLLKIRKEIAEQRVTEKDIKEVPKNEIAPQFGNDSGVVRNDLPLPIKNFVKIHEAYHLNDKKYGAWWKREIRANWHAAKKHPWGFIRTVFASLFSKERLKLYADRIKKGY